jgi:hypothetical protein
MAFSHPRRVEAARDLFTLRVSPRQSETCHVKAGCESVFRKRQAFAETDREGRKLFGSFL